MRLTPFQPISPEEYAAEERRRLHRDELAEDCLVTFFFKTNDALFMAGDAKVDRIKKIQHSGIYIVQLEICGPEMGPELTKFPTIADDADYCLNPAGKRYGFFGNAQMADIIDHELKLMLDQSISA